MGWLGLAPPAYVDGRHSTHEAHRGRYPARHLRRKNAFRLQVLGCGGGSINSVTKPPGQHIANHCSFMYLRKKLSRHSEDKHASTLSGACRLPHWDPGSPSSRVPAFLLARSKINLLRLAVASGARG
jgi:hypothetical protein